MKLTMYIRNTKGSRRQATRLRARKPTSSKFAVNVAAELFIDICINLWSFRNSDRHGRCEYETHLSFHKQASPVCFEWDHISIGLRDQTPTSGTKLTTVFDEATSA